MKPVFCGNFDGETRHSDLERLFSRYGRVDRIDMKSDAPSITIPRECSIAGKGNSLVKDLFLCLPAYKRYGLDEHVLNNVAKLALSLLGLSVEWSRQGDRGSRREGSRAVANTRPSKTLFVINFDPIHTRIRDIERHFEPFGKILHVRIRRNFAFVQFETQEEATKALECTHMSKILDRVVSVEYALRDDGERGDRRDSPRRGGGGYGRRGDSPYGRSVSPVYRRGPTRPSPDYGRARSPIYDRYNGPAYDRNRSPDYGRYRSRSPARRSRS